MKKILRFAAFSTLLFGITGCKNSADDEVVETAPETEEIEEVEEIEEPDTSEIATPGDLSDDLYSFEVSVNGQIHQLPISYEQFESLGWEYKGDPLQSIPSSAYLMVESAQLDDKNIYVDVVNFAPESREVQNSYIGGMTFETYSLKDTDAEIVLPGDIILGEATLEKIEAAYGTPSNQYESETITSYTYTKDSYQEIKLTIPTDTGVLEKIQMKNFAMPDDLEETEIVRETPELITNYKYPDSMSDDLFDYHVEYGGTLYELPIPVAVLIENGWEKLADEEQAIAGGGFSRIQLMKDNQTIQPSIDNFFDFATIIENSHVTLLDSRVTGPEVPIELSHGITLGMSRKDFEKAISGYDYEMQESSLTTSYQIDDPIGRNSGYTFSVSDDTGKLHSISVQYNPKTLD